ncbi:MAG: M3 family oligoendopeptidase [Clostridia bacterium]|nr:M3 family oligoendopeptidase [Clostridia bacterium]
MWKLQDLEYVRPDVDAYRAEYERLIDEMANAASYADQRAALMALEALNKKFGTASSLASIRYDGNTADEFYGEEKKFWNSFFPSMIPLRRKYMETLVSLRFRADFEAEFGPKIFTSAEAQLRLTDDRLADAQRKQSALVMEYSSTVAGSTVEFGGVSCNFYALLKQMQNPDREIRRAAFEAWAGMYERISGKLDDIYDQLVDLRVGMSETLEFPSFTEMAYLQRQRYDYNAEDAAAFRAAVVKYIVPAAAKLYEAQRQRLGVDKLRFYDESLFYPEGNPVPSGTRDELVAKAGQMYRELSPETGEFFDFMIEHNLFDLETRPGKRMGGYCSQIGEYRAPYIFSNFNGTSADVDVLTHEAGHAFQGYLSMRSMPLSALAHANMEINEVHSMAMEHFAYPWMEKFFGDRADAYRRFHLASALTTIPYLVAVDEFQHRVYAKPEMRAAERRAVWHEIEQIYLPWRDYDGNEFLAGGGFWMQKQHIFMYPFYYIEYALARLGAFEFFIKAQKDREAAWGDYLALCRAGGKFGYSGLLEVGGLHNPFSEETIKMVTEEIVRSLESM